MKKWFLGPLLLLAPGCGMLSLQEPTAGPTPGISRELATQRASSISDVSYEIDVDIHPTRDTFKGRCSISFALGEVPDRITVDFRGSRIHGITVGTVDLGGESWEQINNHIVIDGGFLTGGRNTIIIDYEARIGAAGDGLIRSRDADDGSTYVYTLNVPADGHAVFPCFDQPDLKARFTLSVEAPQRWTVVSNSPLKDRIERADDRVHHQFEETPPLSTYVFAFAAGPFVELTDTSEGRSLRFYGRRSQEKLLERHAPEIFRLHRVALKHLEGYFGIPYPFKKLDFLCVPDFPFGGMEHAGCIFYGETPLLFRTEVTRLREARRADLISHETAHMWFGDLVTMPWFDDVWLKEGFATFMAHKVLEATFEGVDHRRSFFLRNVPAALDVDMTAGATPIRQPLANMGDAKSQYGPIIYRKGPLVLAQLEHMMGAESFQHAARNFLEENSFACGDWMSLKHALEAAWNGPGSLDAWSRAWIESPGVPEVSVTARTDGSNRHWLELSQRALDGSQATWPLGLRVAAYQGRTSQVEDVVTSSSTHRVRLMGRNPPAWSFCNLGGHGYVLAALDPPTRAWLSKNFTSVTDGLLRAMIWESLWWEVLETRMSPGEWLGFALRHGGKETDERLVQTITGRMTVCLRRYLSDIQRDAWAPRVEKWLTTRMRNRSMPKGLRLLALRGLFGAVHTNEGADVLLSLIDGKLDLEPITVSNRDRWRALTRLMLIDHSTANDRLTAMKSRDKGDEGRRRAFEVECARRGADHQADLFRRFRQDPSIPERMIQDGSALFFAPEHAHFSREHLAEALEQLEWIKNNRKIFFLAAWVNAAIRGQLRQDEVEIVERYIEKPDTPRDVRLKVLVALDHLRRTVRIREKWAEEPDRP